jgi:hypothetical protein
MDMRPVVTYEDDMDFDIMLDMRIQSDNTDIDANYDDTDTTFTLPYRWDDPTDVMEVVRHYQGDEELYPAGEWLTDGATMDGTAGTIVMAGDLTGSKLVFGLKYSADYTFGLPVIKQVSAEGGTSPVSDGTLTLLFWTINYVDAAWFRAQVILPHGDINKYTFQSDMMTDPGATGKLGDGQMIISVRGRPKEHPQLRVRVFNDRPYDATWVNAGWKGMFTRTGRSL